MSQPMGPPEPRAAWQAGRLQSRDRQGVVRLPNSASNPMSQPTRRDLFQIVTIAPAAAIIATGTARGQAPGRREAAAYNPKVFDAHQWHTISVLCDRILPADDHSGSASQAGVPQFIDDWLDFRKEQDGNDDLTAEILGGIAWLDRESERLFQHTFAEAAPAQQSQILDRIAWPLRATKEDRRWAAFFTKLRDLTACGFFSSKMGIADLPYLGNVAVAEWKGCDPAVWARIEERIRNGYKGLDGTVAPGLFPAG